MNNRQIAKCAAGGNQAVTTAGSGDIWIESCKNNWFVVFYDKIFDIADLTVEE